MREGIETRLADSFEQALKLAEGLAYVDLAEGVAPGREEEQAGGANVTGGASLTGPSKIDGTATTWTSNGNYPVVLVKGAAQDYRVYLNVVAGQVLTTPSTNPHGDLQNISHVSIFVCPSQVS